MSRAPPPPDGPAQPPTRVAGRGEGSARAAPCLCRICADCMPDAPTHRERQGGACLTRLRRARRGRRRAPVPGRADRERLADRDLEPLHGRNGCRPEAVADQIRVSSPSTRAALTARAASMRRWREHRRVRRIRHDVDAGAARERRRRVHGRARGARASAAARGRARRRRSRRAGRAGRSARRERRRWGSPTSAACSPFRLAYAFSTWRTRWHPGWNATVGTPRRPRQIRSAMRCAIVPLGITTAARCRAGRRSAPRGR